MNLDNFIKEEFIDLNLSVSNREEAIRSLGNILQSNGYVRDDYINAVLTREKDFPTGLATKDVHVAIPHSDVEYCIKPGIAIGILAKPVEFFEMATLDKPVDVDMIFLLSITEPKEQVIWLARLTTLFQEPGLLRKLKNLPDPKSFRNELFKNLRKEEQ